LHTIAIDVNYTPQDRTVRYLLERVKVEQGGDTAVLAVTLLCVSAIIKCRDCGAPR